MKEAGKSASGVREVMVWRKPKVIEPKLPRKTSSQTLRARTANRLWWVGRRYQGDRGNSR